MGYCSVGELQPKGSVVLQERSSCTIQHLFLILKSTLLQWQLGWVTHFASLTRERSGVVGGTIVVSLGWVAPVMQWQTSERAGAR